MEKKIFFLLFAFLNSPIGPLVSVANIKPSGQVSFVLWPGVFTILPVWAGLIYDANGSDYFTSFDAPGRGFALRMHTNFKEANTARASILALLLSALRIDSSSLRSPILSPKFLHSAVEGWNRNLDRKVTFVLTFGL